MKGQGVELREAALERAEFVRRRRPRGGEHGIAPHKVRVPVGDAPHALRETKREKREGWERVCVSVFRGAANMGIRRLKSAVLKKKKQSRLQNEEELVDVRLAGEKRLPRRDFDQHASHRPHVHAPAVLCVTHLSMSILFRDFRV